MNMNYASENKLQQCDLINQDEEDDGDDTNNRISSRKLLSLGRAFRLTYSPASVAVYSPKTYLPLPPPHLLREAPVCVIRLRLHHRSSSAAIAFDAALCAELNRQSLVVAEGDALKLVDAGEAAGRDGIELAADAVAAGVGDIEEERDAVGPADEREVGDGTVGSEEDGVVCGE
ncbi:AIG2-like (avirulence induced gene) family protein [Actinidia rufa]|uniref:AIG2-like (Avirulence induced gene) family protein n=1 Tax=Actinidia rufa TaxID=165716 RepID=A0A7J0FRL7_9ERIC|nr:AIG2-like (avirulence induced gene) family protein [Actinidia rufa]